MATSYSPKIITDGLVLCLDVGDKKSLLAPPTTNLANNSNDTINWTTSPLGGTSRTQSTVDADSYHYRFVLGSTMNMRFNFDHTNLTNGETYIVSYKYKITSGSGTFHVTDFCDISVNANRVTTDIGDGWYYETAYGTRLYYDETYDFFDFYASAAMTVDIKEMQVEHTSASSPLATPFVSYQRKWEDRAGSNDGTPENMSDQSNFSSEGRGSLIFDGTDDFISIPTYTFGNGSWTLNMWVNVSAFANYNLMSNSSSGPVANVFGAHGSNPKIFYMNYDGAWKDHYGNLTLTTNNWYMLTWVNYEGASASAGTMKMYVNGIADSSAFNSYTTNGGPCNAIGKRWSGTPFNGNISGVSINTKSLSDAEVLQNYNATKGRFGV